MIRFLPRLTELRPGKPAGKQRQVVVFIHGIFSSHATFAELIDSFEHDARFDSYDLYAYDYDWGEPILTSAGKLRAILNRRVPEGAEITLIGHSMGGLVSRFAIIADDLRGVQRLFMLGTPNFGALSARQLSTLWQTAIAAAGKVSPVFPRKAGLRDLTRPQTLYKRIATRPSTPPAHADTPLARAATVEYVTIPGLFYWDERRDTDPGEQNQALPFTGGTLLLRVMALWPFGQIEIQIPHDGIVEESSVRMMPKEGRVSEKNVALQQPTTNGRTYCHAAPVSMHDCAHMGIQRDEKTAETIKGIMLAGGGVAWKQALSPHQLDGYIGVIEAH